MPRIKELLDTIKKCKTCLINKNAESVLPHSEESTDLYQLQRGHNRQLRNLREILNNYDKEFIIFSERLVVCAQGTKRETVS